MPDTDGVLAAIDACLADSLSPDAMRWAPDRPDLIEQSAYASGAVVWRPILHDVPSDVLEWATAISHPREVISDALVSELESPSRDGLLRINLPDSSQSVHRMVSVAPGETPGEYVLTLEPASEEETP